MVSHPWLLYKPASGDAAASSAAEARLMPSFFQHFLGAVLRKKTQFWALRASKLVSYVFKGLPPAAAHFEYVYQHYLFQSLILNTLNTRIPHVGFRPLRASMLARQG